MPTDLHSILKSHCIALTGGAATGKSSVAHMLRARGFLVIDADVLARDVVTPGRPALAKIATRFGAGVLSEDGTLRRDAMRLIILDDPTAKLDLERIMHPSIRGELWAVIQREKIPDTPRPFFYEATLVHETGQADEFRETWCTICPPEMQIERLTSRTSGVQLSEASAKGLLQLQMPSDRKASLSTRVIDTSGSIASVETQLDALLGQIVYNH